uniref:Ovule protein n=1 Tax=Parascaris univalens TaxID=6257 RepID=A0A915BN19_PARUN
MSPRQRHLPCFVEELGSKRRATSLVYLATIKFIPPQLGLPSYTYHLSFTSFPINVNKNLPGDDTIQMLSCNYSP